MFQKLAAALLAFCLVTSCGGGGGGGGGSNGGGGGSSGVHFTPDHTNVDFVYDEGAVFMPTSSVVVTASGTFNGTLYIGAVADGQGIDPNIQAAITGTSATFSIQAKSGLAAGTYSGHIQLLGCSDQSCNKQIGNSPINLTYTLTVRATLRATPAEVTANSQSGSTTSSNVTVRLPTGATAFTTSFNFGEQWMNIDQVTAGGFRVNLRSLPPGNYSGSIRVSAGTSQVNVPVSYTVAGGVAFSPMAVAPFDFTLTGNEGAVNPPVTLTVTPPSWDPTTSLRFVRAGTADPVPWLSATPVANGYAIVADATNLSAGTYNAQALVSGAYPTQDVQVPIALTIGVGLVLPADQVKVIGSESTAGTLVGTVPVNVVAGPAVTWTAQSFAPWLILTDNAGTTGETLAYRIDPAQLGSLPNNGAEEWGGITITPSRASMSPRTFAVRVSKRLAAVTHVGPYLQPTGRNTRVVLRGYGFDSVNNLAARLQFSGGAVTQITRVNDTELVVNTGPLNLGTFPFSFTNALNATTASAAVKTFTPQNFPASSRATGGPLRGMFYDAERSAVYLVNQQLESLQRFQYTNQWNLTSLSMPAIVSAGLTHEGSRLMVATSTSSQSRIRQLDPNNMNVQISSTDLTQQIAPDWNGTIKTTNDGRSWFAVGGGWNDMAYFDAEANTMTIVRPPINTFFYGGPGFGMSRDGERLMILQTGSNWQDMLYMDAADSEVRVNPANLSNNYQMSLSDDGSRYLHDNAEVRDRDFALIGRLPSPLPRASGDLTDHWPMRSVLSPDGSRVYAIAVPNDFPYQSTPARLYVFDSSTRQQASDELPTLGYLNMANYPACSPPPPNSSSCDYNSHIIVSPDGNTVFVAGSSNFIVVPVANANLNQVMRAPPGSATQKAGRGRMVPWELKLQ